MLSCKIGALNLVRVGVNFWTDRVSFRCWGLHQAPAMDSQVDCVWKQNLGWHADHTQSSIRNPFFLDSSAFQFSLDISDLSLVAACSGCSVSISAVLALWTSSWRAFRGQRCHGRHCLGLPQSVRCAGCGLYEWEIVRSNPNLRWQCAIGERKPHTDEKRPHRHLGSGAQLPRGTWSMSSSSSWHEPRVHQRLGG